jgi:hypothetical protein
MFSNTNVTIKQEGTYLPDFTAYIATETVRCIQISRPVYDAFINQNMRRGPGSRPTMDREPSLFTRVSLV